LNRATIQDLDRLPGVGPTLARRIITAREQAGRFESVDDLRRVAGLGPVRLGRLRGFVTVAE
jgi:competence protein ComEA